LFQWTNSSSTPATSKSESTHTLTISCDDNPSLNGILGFAYNPPFVFKNVGELPSLFPPNNSSPTNSAAEETSHSLAGIIVGAILGGAALILVGVIIGVCAMKRRQKRHSKAVVSNQYSGATMQDNTRHTTLPNPFAHKINRQSFASTTDASTVVGGKSLSKSNSKRSNVHSSMFSSDMGHTTLMSTISEGSDSGTEETYWTRTSRRP
jgi:hypothetical protein